MVRDFLSVDDLSPEELFLLLDLAAKVKAQPGDYASRMAGRSVAMIFEKPSTRTRVSFEIAISSSGGPPVSLSSAELQLGRGETIEDTGRVLSRYVDAIVLRTFEQERLEMLASAASVPVVNALSDFEHPCQCLADLLPGREARGAAGGLAPPGAPGGCEPIPQMVQRAKEIAAGTGGSATVMLDPIEASRDADVLYTDVWASMGQEAEADERALVFPAYALDRDKLEVAKPDVTVMHCLPAHRGQEITAAGVDGPHTVVWDQAENRMHTQKGLLLWLLDLA